MDDTAARRPQGEFPSTLWTQILEAKEGNDASRREALDRLFRAYWKPLYAALRFGWNRNHEDAKDSLQAFLADLVERAFWKDVDPALGRFRSFLKAALRNFMMNEADARARLKRGGDRAHVPLEIGEITPAPSDPGSTPDDILDTEWIQTVLAEAMEQLRKEYPPEEGHVHFDVLRLYYLEPSGTKHPTYADVAQELGISETAVRYYLSDAKQKLRKIVTHIVREYAADDASVEEELAFILG